MNDPLVFVRREAFRAWLRQNCRTGGGVWLLFGKAGGPKTLKPGEALAMDLEARGLMTDFGREKIEEARKNGQWDAPKPPAVTEEQVEQLFALLEGREPAYTNLQAMSLSVRKTYVRAYLDAKTDAGRERRLAWITDRLNQNLKPM